MRINNKKVLANLDVKLDHVQATRIEITYQYYAWPFPEEKDSPCCFHKGHEQLLFA